MSDFYKKDQIEGLPEWQRDAICPEDIHGCELTYGRQFIVRMHTGADPVKAITAFAVKNNIRFGTVHTCFMGVLKPAKYTKWIVDINCPDNWHNEIVATEHNATIVGGVSGMIGQRPRPDGGEETFTAMHFVAGGAWDCGNIVGHMMEGTLVQGCMQCFITELLDIETVAPVDLFNDKYGMPENFYRNTKNDKK